MKQVVFRFCLVGALLAIIMVPQWGSLVRFGDFPPGYGDFPARQGPPVPGFSPTVFWIGVGIELLLAAFFVFPRLFGFKKADPAPKPATTSPFPPWFFVGIAMFVVCLSVFWAKIPVVDIVDPFMNVPIWWGLILALDGLVYRRTGGKSLLGSDPQKVLLLGAISCVGWFIFEYLDFFVLENWYYPNQGFSQYLYIVWLLASYSGIFPLLFEYYQLFQTFPRFSVRYTKGPVVRVSRVGYAVILALGLALSFLMGRFPHEFFLTIWVSPVLIMWAVLGLWGVWTVFSPLEKGNWAPLLMTGVAMLVCGLGWECVNFGSEFFFDYQPVNAIYWKYAIPYVGGVHLPFSEMPILGYMGYIPYAWICWLQWILAGKLLGFDSRLGLEQD